MIRLIFSSAASLIKAFAAAVAFDELRVSEVFGSPDFLFLINYSNGRPPEIEKPAPAADISRILNKHAIIYCITANNGEGFYAKKIN